MAGQSVKYNGSSPSGLEYRQVPLEHGGLRLDQSLAQLFPEHSRNRLQTWIREGRVSVDEKLVDDPKRKLHGGEKLAVELVEAPSDRAEEAEDIPLTILYEDMDIIVIDKPAGLVVHPGSGNWSGTLLNALLHHCPSSAALPRAGIVHRLDKDTSGLLVVAKNEVAQTDLVRQLQARTVKRQYYALARGSLRQGMLVDAPIGRHPTQRIKMAVHSGGREARTQVRVCERFERCTLVECSLETGRTHQIRVHMAHLGHPLVGDAVYGGNRGEPVFHRQALHAWRLGLIHPRTGEAMHWESALPEDFAALLAGLRGETR
ncbi:23S rRNA pseudouridine(1911/1915/1917) synthase RluD [Niveibacterium terrae]|uniref:23S rRNA pseudouridine(1911/1915/1917) synthase RluD n=1 Tax=Niveibacterium terrae TaxID=3373598 RepID=UPI003A94C074